MLFGNAIGAAALAGFLAHGAQFNDSGVFFRHIRPLFEKN
jgi:hypothetical protein